MSEHTDDAYGGYRGMWRDAETEVARLRARAEKAEQRVAMNEKWARDYKRWLELTEQRVRELERDQARMIDTLGRRSDQILQAEQRVRELESEVEQERLRRGFGEQHGLPQQLLECEEALRTTEQRVAELERLVDEANAESSRFEDDRTEARERAESAEALLAEAHEALEGERRVAQAYRDGLGAIATFSVPGVSGGPENNAGSLAQYAQKVLEAGPLTRDAR